MSYVKHLLESTFFLSVSRLVKSGKAPGTKVKIKGKWYMVNKQCYRLSLGRRDSLRFIRLIGFTIQRKQDGIFSS